MGNTRYLVGGNSWLLLGRFQSKQARYRVKSIAVRLLFSKEVGWMGFGTDEPNITEVVGSDVTDPAILLIALLSGL